MDKTADTLTCLWEEVLTIKNGKNQKKVVNPSGKYPIYGSGGIMGYADDYLCEAGTTIIGRKGSINNPLYIETKFWNVDTAFGLQAKDNLDPKYLYYFCLTYNFLKHNKATTLPSLTKADLLKIEIPLPPLEIQKKIVSTLDEADKLRQLNKELVATYEQLGQSLFLEMFGDPTNNSKGWELTLGGETFKFSSGKFNPRKNLAENNKYPTFGGNGITGYSKHYLIDFETVVIGRVGAYCGSIHKTSEKSWITDNAIYIKENKKNWNMTFTYFLLTLLDLNRFANYSGQPKITQEPLQKMELINVPLALQTEFSEILQEIKKQKSQAQQALEHSEELFDSLLQKAFKGELV